VAIRFLQAPDKYVHSQLSFTLRHLVDYTAGDKILPHLGGLKSIRKY